MFMDDKYSIWTEKYRPTKFDEIVGQDAIVSRIRSFVENKQVPHLLFAGPAGCGKSTLSLIIAREMFGKRWKNCFLEMNASDERGIGIIRSKIKDFARTKAIGNIPYKIIFLDEADSLTPEAQSALRRTMESYAKICRFCLSCNYSSRIIEPIQSRCAVFRFKSISEDDIKTRLKIIAEGEKVKISPKALDSVCYLAEGDIRKAINIVQSSAAVGDITDKSVFETVASAHPSEIRKLMELALKGNFLDSRKMLVDLLYKKGVAAEDIIKIVSKEVISMDITEKHKINLMEKIGEYEYRLGMGSNEQIQLEAMLANFAVLKK